MECPYCKREMESGYLAANTKIVWSKAQKEVGDSWLDRNSEDVLISDSALNLLKPAKPRPPSAAPAAS